MSFLRNVYLHFFSIDAENNKVEMTFKTGDLSREKKSAAAAVKEGQKVDGVIKRVEPYGLFIDIEGTKLHGLCHKSEVRYIIIFQCTAC